MRRIWTFFYLVLSALFLFYLLLPNSAYPSQLSASLRSSEPADVESDMRRGYYVDGDRQVVISHYKKEFEKIYFLGRVLNIPSIRLNYPPEEGQTIIRDQTRGTYLEEIVHPFRQSIFVNGFEPKRDNDMIFVSGKKYDQKIIVKQFNSNIIIRLLIGSFALLALYVNILIWINMLREFYCGDHAKGN